MFVVTLNKASLKKFGIGAMCCALVAFSALLGRYISTRTVSVSAGVNKIESAQDIQTWFMGYGLDVIEKGHAAGAIFDDVPFLVSFDTAGRFLSIRALWESDLPAESAEPALFATADNWNREKYFPTVYTSTSPEGTLGVYADFVVDTEAGLSDVQLRDAISSGISTGIAAIQYVKESASEALGLGESGRG